jgi:hypothetical protein
MAEQNLIAPSLACNTLCLQDSQLARRVIISTGDASPRCAFLLPVLTFGEPMSNVSPPRANAALKYPSGAAIPTWKGPRTSVTFRLPVGVAERIKRAAFADSLTVNDWIVQHLDTAAQARLATSMLTDKSKSRSERQTDLVEHINKISGAPNPRPLVNRRRGVSAP